MIVMALMIAAADPSPEALALGKEMAQAGMLATLLPILEADSTEKLVAAFPELDDSGKQTLRETAHQVYLQGRDRLLEADGRAYAEQLSVEDLRALVAFSRTDAATHYRDALPTIAASTMGPLDRWISKRTSSLHSASKPASFAPWTDRRCWLPCVVMTGSG